MWVVKQLLFDVFLNLFKEKPYINKTHECRSLPYLNKCLLLLHSPQLSAVQSFFFTLMEQREDLEKFELYQKWSYIGGGMMHVLVLGFRSTKTE